jgi:hypothetical protein
MRDSLIMQFVYDYGDMNYVSKEILPYIVAEIKEYVKQNPDTLITRDFIEAFCASTLSIYFSNKAKLEQQ